MEFEVTSKPDGNQAAIVSTLRAAGASVTILAGVGCGCPDLLVGFRGKSLLVECKNPDGRGRNSLTLAEVEWFKTWKGGLSAVVNSPEEALSTLFGFSDELE